MKYNKERNSRKR